MENLIINTYVLGMVSTNCYIIHNEDTREAIIIDPADCADKIIEILNMNVLKPTAILLTHGHFDHMLAAPQLIERFNIPLYACEKEVDLLKDANMNCSVSCKKDIVITPKVLVKGRQQLNLLGDEIHVIHTPGHTAGSVCYYFPNQKFVVSGDTLFKQSIGRTDLATGDDLRIVPSIKDKLFCLEDYIKVYPGHGETTTIGFEKEYNPYVDGKYEDLD